LLAVILLLPPVTGFGVVGVAALVSAGFIAPPVVSNSTISISKSVVLVPPIICANAAPPLSRRVKDVHLSNQIICN